ncbi:fimbrial protein [Citrobacter koseri]|uniref:fimbrial protein n=1 Tax=Citrobacter koseri TaxID=545 RepID=UPI001F453931|nr:hypothetical protein [Citrobacter koseri]
MTEREMPVITSVTERKGHKCALWKWQNGAAVPLMIVYLFALSGMSYIPAAGANAKLTITAPVVSATCEINLLTPANLLMGNFVADDFAQNGGTASLGVISMGVENCEGDSGGMNAQIVVSGETLTGNTSIFNDDPDGTAGFMLKADSYTGALTGFKNAAGTVNAGDATYVGFATVPSTVLDYTVGFVAPDSVTPLVARVSSGLTFEFRYQ